MTVLLSSAEPDGLPADALRPHDLFVHSTTVVANPITSIVNWTAPLAESCQVIGLHSALSSHNRNFLEADRESDRIKT
jgi:hypothetical protein